MLLTKMNEILKEETYYDNKQIYLWELEELRLDFQVKDLILKVEMIFNIILINLNILYMI